MIAVHIGLKKSGSSTIQHFFSTNRLALRRVAVNFPSAALSSNNHQNVAQELTGSLRFDPRLGTLSDLVAYRRRKKKRTMFLSSEAFEGLESGDISELKNCLSANGRQEDFRIVMIVRDLVDLIPSSYAQKIKFGHHSYDFDTFFRSRMKQDRVDYFETAKRWADVFGWENMKVRSLAPENLRNGDLIDEVLVILGVDPADERVAEMDRTEIRNIRPGWKVLESVRALSTGTHGLMKSHPILMAVEASKGKHKMGRLEMKFGKALGRLALKAGEELGWNDDKGRYLTHAQAQDCFDTYRYAIGQLNSHLLDKLPEPKSLSERAFFERQEMPSVELISRAELMNFYDLTGSLWHEQFAGKDNNS